MAAKALQIKNRQNLEQWLQDKPERLAQDLTVRTALRILPLVFTIFDIDDGLLSLDKKQFTLYALRAAFVSWTVSKYPPFDELSVVAQQAGEQVFADAASRAAEAINTVAKALSDARGDKISLAINAAKASAFAAEVNTDVGAGAHAAFACSAAEAAANYPSNTGSHASVVWEAISADASWLAKNRGESLIEQPLWLIDVRGNPEFAANFPPWIRGPFDQFDKSALAKGGPWRMWLNWYRAILPNTSNGKPRSVFDENIDFKIATQPNAFWDRNPDEVMEDVKAITEHREPIFQPQGIAREMSTHATSDLWTIEDKLGYAEYARAIYHFINDPRTEPPLTISIQAPWGGGKTSLMRMVQKQVDPKGYERALRTGGPTLTETLKATTQNLLDELRNLTRKKPTTISLDLGEGNCASIWFNAWRYQSSDQIWSGLAEAIIRGVTDRLDPIDREKFLLRLHLSRVNPGQIRSKVYDAIFQRFVDYLRRYIIWIWLVLAALSVALWDQIVVCLGGYLPSTISVAGTGILAAGLAYIMAKQETDTEPAKLNLSDYVEVPDYSEKLGYVHHVTEDLRRVFELLVEERDGKKRPVPLVIFIDDLDRCTPDNVADVFEAINQFIAGEFPNCYIVLGMDSEMVAAALEEAHKNVIQRLPSYVRRVPIGWRFMDKFVQLPFVIPPLDADAVENYSDYLAAAEDVDAREVQDRASSDVAGAAEELIQKSFAEGKDEAEIVEQVAEQYVSGGGGEPRSKAMEEGRRLAEQKVDSFKRIRFIDKQARAFRSDSEKIQSLLRASKDEFQSNPRELKRLVNVYRFYYNLRLARQSRNQPVPTEGQLQNWLTMSLAWPDVIRWLRRSHSDWEPDPSENTATAISYRLRKLEELAVKPVRRTTGSKTSAKETRPPTVREWVEAVCEEFGLPENVPWLGDERFFRFVKDMASGDSEQRLSGGAGKGFW